MQCNNNNNNNKTSHSDYTLPFAITKLYNLKK